MTAQTFSGHLFQDGSNTGIEVPPATDEALGSGRRPAVVMTVNGYTYRSTVAVMGGRHLISFSSDRRRETGLAGGDAIDVTLELDTAPRTVEVPPRPGGGARRGPRGASSVRRPLAHPPSGGRERLSAA